MDDSDAEGDAVELEAAVDWLMTIVVDTDEL